MKDEKVWRYWQKMISDVIKLKNNIASMLGDVIILKQL